MEKTSKISSNDTLIKHFNSENMEKAEQELEELYGKRYALYRKQYQQASKLEYIPEFPLYMMLEQTYRCNLRCVSCVHGYPNFRKKFSCITYKSIQIQSIIFLLFLHVFHQIY